MRIEKKPGLKADQWIDVLDVDDVPHGVHVKVEKLYPDPGQPLPLPLVRRMRNTFMAEIITGWSFGDTPPGSPEALEALPAGAYRELMKATDPHYIDAGFMIDPATLNAGKAQEEDSPSATGSSSD